jgi:hypothetical protein
MANVTYDQLFHPEVIIGVAQRFKKSPSLFQKMFGMEITDGAAEQFPGKHGQIDLVDPTRIVGGIRGDEAAPRRVQPKVVGAFSVDCYRFYESILVNSNKLYPLRAIGGPSSQVEAGGKSHFRQQVTHLLDRVANLREFAITRTLMGGFDLKILNNDPQNMVPVESGAGDVTINTNLPASQTGQLPCGGTTGTDNLITASWDTDADIAAQVSLIDEHMQLYSGLPLKHVFITTPTFNAMRTNSELQSQGGSVQRPWDSWSVNPDKTEGQNLSGYTVEFRAMPNILFHVYDSFLQLEADSDKQSDQRDKSKLTKVIPDNKALFLPEVGTDWFGWAAGSEYVKKNIASVEDSLVQGFSTWSVPSTDPPGREVRVMDIGLPYLKVARAPMFGTVIYS